MNSGLVSTRYATALLEYAISNSEQEAVYEKMKLLSELFLSFPKLQKVLQKISLSNRDKKSIITTACGGDLPSSLDKMTDLILKNERANALQFIVLQYLDLYRNKFHILTGRLTSAVILGEEERERFTRRIEKIVGQKIEMETTEDPSIIGGFILQLGDYRWDSSISGELTRIKRRWLHANGSENVRNMEEQD